MILFTPYHSVSLCALAVYENSCLAQLQALQGLSGTTSSQTQIGIKRMGELDSKAFLNMCKRKFAAEDAEAESTILCSKWQDDIKNPEWNPFKVIMVNGNVLVRTFAFCHLGIDCHACLRKQWIIGCICLCRK